MASATARAAIMLAVRTAMGFSRRFWLPGVPVEAEGAVFAMMDDVVGEGGDGFDVR